jgi:hypothetical protein
VVRKNLTEGHSSEDGKHPSNLDKRVINSEMDANRFKEAPEETEEFLTFVVFSDLIGVGSFDNLVLGAVKPMAKPWLLFEFESTIHRCCNGQQGHHCQEAN